MENLKKQTGNTSASINTRTQDKEERISGDEDTVEK